MQRAFPEVLEALRKRNSRDIRIWTAGCSTGEEPYTIVMLMMDYLEREYGLWNGGILATDISEKALKIAIEGIYPEDRAKELSKGLKLKYFNKLADDQLAVKDAVKKEVVFRKFNLKNNNFPFKEPFQIVFCRNVMIYFDRSTRDKLLQQFHEITETGGYLFIGHSETLGREQQLYRYIMPAVYQKM